CPISWPTYCLRNSTTISSFLKAEVSSLGGRRMGVVPDLLHNRFNKTRCTEKRPTDIQLAIDWNVYYTRLTNGEASLEGRLREERPVPVYSRSNVFVRPSQT
ncbi:unnamed protein product, partial [Heterotrigona itama]